MLNLILSICIATEIDDSIKRASKQYKLNPEYLYQVLKVESGPRIFKGIRLNKNGSFDIGPFQINSIHIKHTCKEYILAYTDDNVKCAAKIIKKIKDKHSQNETNWLSRYHSNTEEKRKIYEKKLFLAKDF